MARDNDITDDTGTARTGSTPDDRIMTDGTRDDRTMVTDGTRHRATAMETDTTRDTMRDDRAVRTDRDGDGVPDEVDLRDREHRTVVARDHVARQHE